MLAIIDADVICYQACYGIWESYLKKIGRITDTTKFIELDEEGQKRALELSPQDERIMLEKCWNNFKLTVQHFLDELYCDEFLAVVKGKDNFRDVIYPEYKKHPSRLNPDPLKRNRFVPILRQLAVMEDYAIAADGRESDDYLRIWAEEARVAGDPFVILTNDKDMRCIPGKYANIHRGSNVSLKDWRLVVEDITEEQAMRHYYAQLLSGDPTDNIPGIPGVATKTALKLLKGSNTEEEMQDVVVSNYLLAFPNTWYSTLLTNGKMIHLQKDLNDYFRIRDWKIIRELC